MDKLQTRESMLQGLEKPVDITMLLELDGQSLGELMCAAGIISRAELNAALLRRSKRRVARALAEEPR